MRLILALMLIAAAVAVAVFFADHPGHVAIVWQGWRVDTSIGVLAAAMVLLAGLAGSLALVVSALGRVPGRLRRRRAARRRRAGETALNRGLVALAAGDAGAARVQSLRAASLLDDAAIALLLAAEAAQRQGDAAEAGRAYTALLARPHTEFLGLRGLIGQALRGGDDATARRLAERARRLRPDAGWLVEGLLELQARAGDWMAAQQTLAAAMRNKTLPATPARHSQAVVLLELSRAAERRGETGAAVKLAARSQARAPDLAPAAAHHARLLRELGRRRAADRAIERAWRRAPHPELAGLYLDNRPDAAPLSRAAAVQRLIAGNPDAPESHLAIAEAALDARLWGEARHHLGRAIAAASPAGPARRLCLLVARLEEGEANAAAARDWRDRALGAPHDPCYRCARCAGDTGEWAPLCPYCGGFDTLSWQVPADRHMGGQAPLAPAVAPLMLAAPAGRGQQQTERLGDGDAIG